MEQNMFYGWNGIGPIFFSGIGHLKMHEMTHTGEKPFVCSKILAILYKVLLWKTRIGFIEEKSHWPVQNVTSPLQKMVGWRHMTMEQNMFYEWNGIGPIFFSGIGPKAKAVGHSYK